MTTMAKVTARWTGFMGAPGYSNFFWANPASDEWDVNLADQCTGAVWAFFSQIKTVLPPTVRVNVLGDVELIEDTRGELLDVIPLGTREQVAGEALDSPYSAPSGAVVTWRTAGVKRGRRVRGRTFLVPLANVAYETDGTLNGATIGILQTAAQNMIGNTGVADPGVWSRPSAVGAADGGWFIIQGATVPDMGAVLRSRRN